MIECDMLIAQAKSARMARDLDRAAVLYGAAVQCLRHAGDAARLAHTLRHFGDVLLEAGSVTAALAPLEEALRLRRADAALDALELANTLRPLALAYGALGREADCIATWREARDLYSARGIQPPASTKPTALWRGSARCERGRTPRARGCCWHIVHCAYNAHRRRKAAQLGVLQCSAMSGAGEKHPLNLIWIMPAKGSL